MQSRRLITGEGPDSSMDNNVRLERLQAEREGGNKERLQSRRAAVRIVHNLFIVLGY